MLNTSLNHEQNYRVLDPTKIGMTTDVIEAIEHESFMQKGIAFTNLATQHPLDAYSLVRRAYESQPHDKPPMPEAATIPKLDVYSVTRHTGIRGLIRAIRSLPTEEATHFATIVFDGGDDGTPQPVLESYGHTNKVVPLHQPQKTTNNPHTRAA